MHINYLLFFFFVGFHWSVDTLLHKWSCKKILHKSVRLSLLPSRILEKLGSPLFSPLQTLKVGSLKCTLNFGIIFPRKIHKIIVFCMNITTKMLFTTIYAQYAQYMSKYAEMCAAACKFWKNTCQFVSTNPIFFHSLSLTSIWKVRSPPLLMKIPPFLFTKTQIFFKFPPFWNFQILSSPYTMFR